MQKGKSWIFPKFFGLGGAKMLDFCVPISRIINVKRTYEREVRPMKKVNVYLDMDGTIANLYGQENWLARLLKEEDELFATCEPMTTEEVIFRVFPKNQFKVKILSMTPKDVSKAYCEKVIAEKNEWLDKFFPHITERYYLPYGENKNLKNSAKAILVDDSEKIRSNFKGLALNPTDLWG